MRGMPKVLKTKQDYLNCLLDYPAETKKELQKLLDDRFIWSCKGEIVADNGEDLVVDETHKVLADEKDNKLYQYEYIEDTNAKIFRIGFTVKEVEKLIGE